MLVGGAVAESWMIDRRYELEALPLARGGMGEVWVGRDVKLDREIAVKFVRFPDGRPDDELVRRFIRESRITARLMHPGVPAVYDAGTHEGRPYLVMRRVHDPRVLELRRQLGLLQLGAGQRAAAARTLAALLADLQRVSGPVHPMVPVVRELLVGADGPAE